MDDNKTTVPDAGKTEEVKTPPTDSNSSGDAHKQEVPEKLQGKSDSELVKMYVELEKKIGEQGNELGQARKFQQDMALVLETIEANPNLKTEIQKELKKATGFKEPDVNKPSQDSTKTDETRRAVEAQIIKEFEGTHGLNSLNQEEKAKTYSKIGDELIDMFDPSGKKTTAQILDEIDLTKLPRMLEKAYFLVNRGEGENRAQKEGMIGSIPSSSSVSDSEGLNQDERKAAKRLGISEDDYLKQKKEILEKKYG